MAHDKNLRNQLEQQQEILKKLIELLMDPSTRDESLLASLSALRALLDHEKCFSQLVYEYPGALEAISAQIRSSSSSIRVEVARILSSVNEHLKLPSDYKNVFRWLLTGLIA